MNFLKRAGVILMVVAIFASSCNKYADDFKQLNTKLDLLATQVAGVTALVADMSAVKSQVTALQTAVAGLPNTASITALATSLTAVSGKVDALQTTLNTVAASGTATKAVVDGLKTDLATLATKVAADNKTMGDNITAALAQLATLGTKVTGIDSKVNDLTTNLATLNTNVTALQTAVATNKTNIQGVADQVTAQALKVQAIADQITALATQTANSDAAELLRSATNSATAAARNANVLAQIALIQTALTTAAQTGAASDAVTALTIGGLQAMLNAQKAQLVQILANTAMYNGNVSITTDAEVAFWKPKVAQLGMINGVLTINTTAITNQTDLDAILGNVTAVIGGAAGTSQIIVTAAAGKKVNLSKLASVVGDLAVTGAAAVTQASVLDLSVLSSVTGDLKLNFDGPYALTNSLTVGRDLVLTDNPVAAAPVRVGTTSVSFPSTTVTRNLGGGAAEAFLLATSIDVAGNATSLNAPSALSVNLRGNYTAGFALTANLATSVTINAASTAGAIGVAANAATSVSFPNLTTAGAGNAVGITTAAATAFSAPKLVTSGAVTITNGAANNGTVDLTAFNSNVAVGITGPKTVTLPAYVTGALTANQATTVTLAKHDGATAPVLPAVTSLTYGALNTAGFDISTASYPALLTASVTAKTIAAGVTTGATNTTMTTLTLTGPMATVNVNAATKLTSLTTSGVINSMTVNGASVLTAVSFAHTHLVGGTGSVLVVTGNPKLTSLKSSTDYPKTITVTGNILLTSLDLSSYVTTLLNAAGATTDITISNNKLSGNYTNAVAITPTTPYVETTITSVDLKTLKAFIALHTAANPVLTLKLDVDLVTLAGGATTAALSEIAGAGTGRMKLDAAHTPAFVGTAFGINSKAEMLLVQ